MMHRLDATGMRKLGVVGWRPFRARCLRRVAAAAVCAAVEVFARCSAGAAPATLPDTAPLTLDGDIASNMVAGIDRFLLRELAASGERREQRWQPDFSSPAAYTNSLAPDRQRLAHILGARDPRVTFTAPDLVATTERPALLAQGNGFEVYALRWPAFADVHGEGLLLKPVNRAPIADVIAIPDCEQTPEQLAGLTRGLAPDSQFARRLAERGCRVVVPVLINRNRGPHLGRSQITAREFLHRPAFELGRHLLGYEAQKVMALADWLERDAAAGERLGVMGYGEGGLLALYTAALDARFQVACVSGSFGTRQDTWQEPLDRNVFGLLERFGDAELAGLIAPRALIVEAAQAPEAVFPGDHGGAPARLVTPDLAVVKRELDRARTRVERLQPAPQLACVPSGDGHGPFGSSAALEAFLGTLLGTPVPAGQAGPVEVLGTLPLPEHRQAAQFHELDRHNQALLAESPYVRAAFMKQFDFSSLEKHRGSVERGRKFFAEEVIGRFDGPLLPPQPRSRLLRENDKWTAYEVVLDVHPDVLAYGILLLPRGLQPGEHRPVVVCQHGLEGRAIQTIEGGSNSYHDFAARLAERGFITFAPQNPYIFGDRFRTLQRKANLLGKTLFSVIAAQHQQILNWLKTLPQVDGERIAFYGLSYGGKSALRLPALLPDYCLSICSADFNDWVWKNASTRSPYSYVWTGEYEIFEFDLGSTFNYAEMAALIAPRPFMVERGHFDGVAPDEAVAAEFAKVRHLYAARLKLPERVAIEFFPGPHMINGQGTFEFLHRHLNWPAVPAQASPATVTNTNRSPAPR
jgi:dienelactone hydrolase